MPAKVYIVDHQHQCDYKVHFVDHNHQEKNHQIIEGGSLVNHFHQADVKVYIVDHSHQGDIHIMRKNFPR